MLRRAEAVYVAQGKADQVYRGNLNRLLAYVGEQRGFDASRYRPQYVERRVATRLRALGLHSYRQYRDYLEEDPGEFDRLLDALTINVTEFFRDAPVYDLIRSEVIPQIIADKLASGGDTIRVWSAGCATGEEPFSVAMLLLEALGEQAHSLRVNILATDLDEGALESARAGRYPEERIKAIPQELQVKYLEVDAETFTIRPEVRALIKFTRFDLFSDKPPGAVDLLLCRNVFIYFNRDQQIEVLETFWSTLSSGGYLVLGRSERLSPGIARRFELVSGRQRVYRKPHARPQRLGAE